MKLKNTLFYLVIIPLFILSSCDQKKSEDKIKSTQKVNTKEKQLRHIVLFKFNDSATPDIIKTVENEFVKLKSKIPQIKNFEWGLNNSPEGLNKDFTHCFFVTFNSEEDRLTYLPHPDHKAFVELIGPYIADVLVFDYWT